MIMMSEQVAPSAVAQRIIVKFLTNENVKHDEFLIKTQNTVWWWNALKDPGVWREWVTLK